MIKFVCSALLIAGFSYGFGYLALDAMARESEWRQERLCKYYADEINAYAMSKGEQKAC